MHSSRRSLSLWVALCALAACGSETTSDSATDAPRAVVIGIDGADWRVIEEVAAGGGMPNLMRLRERGTWGPIETARDIAPSPVIWTTVATGKPAAKHGISWFLVDQPDGTRVPVQSTNRQARALWNILADHGRRASVVGWWATYPAEDVGAGTIVSDALGFHGFGATARDAPDARKTYPAERFREFDALVPPEQQVSVDFAQRFLHIEADTFREERFDPARHPQRDPTNPIHLFQQYAVTAEGYAAIGDVLLSEPYDLCMLYFEQVDSVSHLFMKYAEPRLPWIDEEGFARYRDVVHEWYRYQDELLGRLLERIDLDETAVFVLSDHGFKSGDRRIRSETVVDAQRAHLDHETDGIFVAAGPHIRSGARIDDATVLDVAPTVLHYLDLPVGKDMDGKVLESLFTEDLRAERKIRYVSSHEPDGPQRSSGDADAEAGLEMLGYTGEEEVETTASSPEMHNNLGSVHLKNGDLERAFEEFQRARELAPDNVEALLNIGSIHYLRGESEQALHFARRALAIDPNSVGALAQLGELHRDRGELDEAERLFREALAIDGSQMFLHLGLGDVLQRQGRFEEAITRFEHVLEVEVDSTKARYNLGVTYTNLGRLEDAIRVYEEALQLAPDGEDAPATHNNLGTIFLELGQSGRALAEFEAALRGSPYHLESRFNAALIHLERGDLGSGIVYLEQAAALNPNHEQVLVRLGFAYLAALRGDDARRSLLVVRRLYPQNWTASIGLAVLAVRAGEPEEAQTLLTAGLEAGGDAARGLASEFPLLASFLDGDEASD